MSTPIEEDDFSYVSPADFDEPGDREEDVKAKDEVDLPVLEDVLHYLEREIDKCTRIDSVTGDERDPELTLEQSFAVQRKLAARLKTLHTKIQSVIEGIEEKYDETNR